MTKKYLIVNKTNNKIEGAPVYHNNTDMPINEDILAYVEATDELVGLLDFEVKDAVLDTANTTYNFATNVWNVVTKAVPVADIRQNRLKDLNTLKVEAQRYLNIVDLPQPLKDKINIYIAELNAITIPETSTEAAPGSSATIVWPNKPW